MLRLLEHDLVALTGLSHADHHELVESLQPLAGTTSAVHLVHAELLRWQALVEALHAVGFADVTAPDRGESLAIT
jgi:hypothetical protein